MVKWIHLTFSVLWEQIRLLCELLQSERFVSSGKVTLTQKMHLKLGTPRFEGPIGIALKRLSASTLVPVSSGVTVSCSGSGAAGIV